MPTWTLLVRRQQEKKTGILEKNGILPGSDPESVISPTEIQIRLVTFRSICAIANEPPF